MFKFFRHEFGYLFHPNADIGVMNEEVGDIVDEPQDTPEDEPEEPEHTEEDEPQDEPENEDVEEDEDKDKDEDEEDDDKEKEPEEEEEEDLKLTTTVTDIKKEFPEFFKKFPDVKAAMFREQRYLETVGTLDQAEAAAGKANILDQINDDIINKGDVVPFLDTLKGNSESFTKVMNQILPYLQENNKDLYLEVAAVPIKQLLRAAWRQGKGNTSNLGKAAMYIHDFFFNGDRDIEGKLNNESLPKPAEKSDREKQLEERLGKIEQKEYESFKGDVDNRYIGTMSRYIKDTLDKDERLTDYMKEKITEDMLGDIFKQLESDERFVKQRTALWNGARQSGWHNDFKSRLLSTVLARAKSLVPEARKKAVAKALGRKSSSTNDKDKGNKGRFTREEKPPVKRQAQPSNKPKTDLDILRES